MANLPDQATQKVKRNALGKSKTDTASKKPTLSAEFVVNSDSEGEKQYTLGSRGSVESSHRKSSPLANFRISTPAKNAVSKTAGKTALVSKVKTLESTLPPVRNEPLPTSENESESSESLHDVQQTSSSSGDENESETSDSTGTGTEIPLNKTGDTPSLERVSSIYKPPDGFKRMSNSLPSSPALHELFSPSNIQQKQLWYFILPTTMSLKALEAASMQSLFNHEATFSYNGNEFNLVHTSKNEPATEHILISGEDHNVYQAVPARISQVLQPRQATNFSRITTVSKTQHMTPHTTSAPLKSYKKFIRPQPNGLKMRYRPFGDAYELRGTDGMSLESGDGEDPVSSFSHPLTSGDARSLPKRRVEDIGYSSGVAPEGRAKKRQKKLEACSADNEKKEMKIKSVVIEDQQPEDKKSYLNGFRGKDDLANTLKSNGLSNGISKVRDDESNKEKARRKEEKRRKRQKRVENSQIAARAKVPPDLRSEKYQIKLMDDS